MLKHGILNPALNHLLARVRHTNTLVIADRGFPFWPSIETVDITLVDDIPTVADVLRAVKAQAAFGKAWMAEEFVRVNGENALENRRTILGDTPLVLVGHGALKERVPKAVGLIRTADTLHYSNIILESA
jgi:D-ribose pyranase